MGVRVEVGEGESLASALRRFRKYVRSANVMHDHHRHAEFSKRCEERRRRKGNAKLRAKGMRSWYEIERQREAKAAWPDPPRPTR
jgi:ribosomal protein S21